MQGPETPGVWWAFLCHATRSCWRLVQASSLAWYQWAKQHLAIRCSPGSWKEGWKDLFFFPHEEPSSIHCISIHNCFVNPQMSGMMQIKLDSRIPRQIPWDAFQICAFYLRISAEKWVRVNLWWCYMTWTSNEGLKLMRHMGMSYFVRDGCQEVLENYMLLWTPKLFQS